MLVLALALWLSVRGGTIRPGVLVALVAVSGIVSGLGIPAWQSFVVELVPRESLLNAVTLNSGQFNVTRALGFMLGGVALYSAGRFVVQFFRLDSPFFMGLSQAQFLAFTVGAAAVWILVFQWVRASRQPIDEDDTELDEVLADESTVTR